MKLIEAWGSGIPKMNAELDGYPEIELVLQEAGQAFQVQFVKKGFFDRQKRDQAGTKQGPSRHQVGTKLNLTPDQVNILKLCDKPFSVADLMKLGGRTDRTKFRNRAINPLLGAGLLEMTDPESPKSPKQKYRTTDKGKRLLETK